MLRHEKDPDYPCPSAYPWQLWRADNGSADYANIICEAVDCIIAVNVAQHSAQAIVACHNGEAEPDQSSRPKGTAMPLQPHEKRVLTERAELAEKCVKLEAFIVSDAFKSVDILDRDLLEEQHNAMTVYLAVLDRRIERFATKSK